MPTNPQYKHFYKDRQYPYRICKVCGVKYRAPYKSGRWASRMCYTHRKEWQRYYNNLPEVKTKRKEYLSRPEVKKRNAIFWKQWVANNLERRREIARRSARRRYHETYIPKTKVPRDLVLVL